MKQKDQKNAEEPKSKAPDDRSPHSPNQQPQGNFAIVVNQQDAVNENSPELMESYTELAHAYNPDDMPPNIDLALQHQSATRVGPPIKIQENKRHVFCKCCLRETQRSQLGWNCDNKELLFLGSGYPLFLDFYKNCILILMIYFVVSGLYNFLTNLWYGEDCKDNIIYSATLCYSTWFTRSSLGNKVSKKDLFQMQEYLNLFSIGMIIIFIQFFRKDQRELFIQYDLKDAKVSKYSVFLRNLPANVYPEQNNYEFDLKRYIENVIFQVNRIKKANEDEMKVNNICFCYKLEQYEKCIALKNKAIQDYIKKQSKDKISINFSAPEVQNIVSQFNQNLKQCIQRYTINYSQETMKDYLAGNAFVTFNNQEDQANFLEFCKIPFAKQICSNYTKLHYQNEYLVAEPALEPNQILWSNMGQNKKLKQKTIIKSYLIMAGVLLLSGVIQFAVLKFLQSLKDNKDNRQTLAPLNINSSTYLLAIVIGTVLSVIMIAFNYVLGIVVAMRIDQEKSVTVEEGLVECGRRLSISQFINSSIFLLILGVSINGKDKASDNILGQVGLAQNQTIFLICWSAVPIIVNLINFPFLIKNAKRRKAEKNIYQCYMTQSQLMELFENPVFQVAQYYGQLLSTMFTCAFYGPFIPMAFIYSIISLVIQYYSIKKILVLQSFPKYQLSINLSLQMTGMMELILPIYSIGNLLFGYYLRDTNDISLLGWFSLGIGLFHALFPTHFVNQQLFSLKQNDATSELFQQVILKLKCTYNSENPITRERNRDFVNNLVKKHQVLIIEEQQKSAQKDSKPQQGEESKVVGDRAPQDPTKTPQKGKELNLQQSRQQLPPSDHQKNPPQLDQLHQILELTEPSQSKIQQQQLLLKSSKQNVLFPTGKQPVTIPQNIEELYKNQTTEIENLQKKCKQLFSQANQQPQDMIVFYTSQ